MAKLTEEQRRMVVDALAAWMEGLLNSPAKQAEWENKYGRLDWRFPGSGVKYHG